MGSNIGKDEGLCSVVTESVKEVARVPVWTKLTPATLPGKRSDLGMVYDSVRQVVVMFGGQGSQVFADTWTFDGTNWTKKSPSSSPDARWGPGMAFDRDGGDVVLFGGEGADFFPRDDTWTWDGTNWTERTPATSPVARFRMPMEWTANNQVLLFGGVGADSYGDTWTWDGTNWTQRFQG